MFEVTLMYQYVYFVIWLTYQMYMSVNLCFFVYVIAVKVKQYNDRVVTLSFRHHALPEILLLYSMLFQYSIFNISRLY